MTRLVLAIDTATAAVTAGVVRVGDRIDVLAERVTENPRAHAECLTPNVLAALDDSSVSMDQLDAVVVGCGPGPFTGLRVGMATAAAYGHALGIPVGKARPATDRTPTGASVRGTASTSWARRAARPCAPAFRG